MTIYLVAVSLFLVLMAILFFFLYVFLNIIGLEEKLSGFLSAMIVAALFFGVIEILFKSLFIGFSVFIFFIVSRWLVIRAKKMQWQDYEEKKGIGIYSEISYLKRGGEL